MDLPRDLVGCFELHQSKRTYHATPRLRLNADTVPPEIRRFVRDSTSPAWTLTRLDANGGPVEHAGQGVLFWQRIGQSDRLRVMMHTGFSGTELRLHLAADTLRGGATEYWDVGPPFSNPGGPVSLVRIPCLVQPDSA